MVCQCQQPPRFKKFNLGISPHYFLSGTCVSSHQDLRHTVRISPALKDAGCVDNLVFLEFGIQDPSPNSFHTLHMLG